MNLLGAFAPTAGKRRLVGTERSGGVPFVECERAWSTPRNGLSIGGGNAGNTHRSKNNKHNSVMEMDTAKWARRSERRYRGGADGDIKCRFKNN